MNFRYHEDFDSSSLRSDFFGKMNFRRFAELRGVIFAEIWRELN
tara:strand:- start:22145 stop:22276 length:132 start_codon:yes stop_codon:yes gene_type:complete